MNENTGSEKLHKIMYGRLVVFIFGAALVVGIFTSFAYFTFFGDNAKKFSADLKTGDMALVFSDRDNGVNAKLALGETVTKKFTIENVGSLTGLLNFEWVDMVNTYSFRSLSYNLEYCSENCESENAVYTKILDETNIPYSSKPLTQNLASEIAVPAKTTYYYNLNITLNDLEDIDQTGDKDSIFTTHFQVGEASKYRYYTLKINPNGGVWNNNTDVQEYKLMNNETKQVERPTRKGYTFGGWELSGVASSIEDETFTMGINDALLTAKWEVNKRVITVVIDGEERTYEISIGESIDLEEPQVDGKTFTGWNVSGGKIEGNTFTLTEDVDVTIEATFVDKTYSYTVNHYTLNLDGSTYTLADVDTGNVKSGVEITPSVKSYTGFTSPEVSTIIVSEDVSENIVNYYYQRNQYNLTIDLAGGVYNESSENITRKLYYDETIDLGVASKVGYTFSRWKKMAENDAVLEGNSLTIKDSDVTVRAVFTPKEFTITFNANGGSTQLESKNVTYDSAYGELPVPEYEGYEFLGWFTENNGGEEITASSLVNITDNQTLYAHWRRASVLVTFDANGGTVDTANKEVFFGSTYGELPTANKDGMSFSGWYTEASGGTKVDAETIVSIKDAHTLFAQYTIAPGIDGTLSILGNEVIDKTPNFVNPSPPASVTMVSNSPFKDLTLTNSTSYPFAYDEETGTYTSTNKVHSTSVSMYLRPNKTAHLYIFYAVSSASGDRGLIYLDDNLLFNNSGTLSGYFDLGEIGPENEIRIVYVKNQSGSSGYDNFKVYLSDDVSSTDDTGMYKMEDDYGESYFYRGAMENNYVKFAGYYWRIIRVNGDGSLRIQYDGNKAYANGTSNADRVAMTNEAWNNVYTNDNKYSGYMYGGLNRGSSTSKEEAQKNETNSNVKNQLENWYYNNIRGFDLDNYMSDNIFCNDRSTSSTAKSWWTSDTTLGYGTSATAYGAFSRFRTTSNGWNTTSVTPSFKCQNKNDAFTKHDTEKGNGNLKEKVGLITADEIVAVGSGINKSNTRYYLYKGQYYYSLTPYVYNSNNYMFYFANNGSLATTLVNAVSGLAPVINLSPEFVVSLKGKGTAEDPFTRSLTEIRVALDVNGGEEIETKGFMREPGDVYGSLPVTKRDGYVFDGWYTDSEEGIKVDEETVISATENQTLYAHWKPYENPKVKDILDKFGITPNEGQPNFSTIATTDEGVFAMPDDYGNSYYYRGASENNYVYFAGFYWRIIRINGDGSLRIIYDGTEKHNNGESSTDRVVNTTLMYNSRVNDNKYVGFMYSPSGTTVSISKEQAQTNEVDSNAKTELEAWYQTNIVEQDLDRYVGDELFCNNRKIPGRSNSGFSGDTGYGFGTSMTAYESYTHVESQKNPKFTCPQKNDRFTKDDLNYGNGSLEQKVGLITIDEVIAAGAEYSTTNKNYYLYKGTNYWTLSPRSLTVSTSSSSTTYNAYNYYVYSTGRISYSSPSNKYGTAPVINLSYDYVSSFNGTGTSSDPYRPYKENEVIISLDSGDIVIKPDSMISEVGNAYGELPVPAKTGYTFGGWFTGVDGTGDEIREDTIITNTENHTLYAYMIPNNYTVTLNGNGITSEPASKTVTYDSTYGELPQLEREGYVFNGWYTSTSGGTKIEEDTQVTITANQTLYARWTAKQYTVTYDANTGTCSTASKVVTFGSAYSTLATPTKTGYNFEGWFTEKTGGTKITSSSRVTTAADHTLYAHWTLKSFTVSFNVNGGTNSGSSSNTVYWGETYGYLPYAYREGYTFDGWWTSSTGGTKITTDTIVNLTANQTLYAHWIGNNYTVYFDANNGNVDTSSMTVTMGASYGTLPTPTYSKGSFAGWYTAKTGGTRITNTSKVNISSNHTLYARWTIASGINVTLSVLNINANTTTPDFGTYTTSDEGVFTLPDDYGTSYYYRGAVTNNYVKFGTWKYGTKAGKPMYWRIIRVNGDGSIRMIYDGTQAHANMVENTDRLVYQDIKFNSYADDAKYNGYMYGGTEGSASTSKTNAQANTNDSYIKSVVEQWYKDNLAEEDDYIADKIFCNDRSIVNGTGFGTTDTDYGGTKFFKYNSNGSSSPVGTTPVFKCRQRADAFTKNDTTKGNGKLTQKVGLITADELVAGGYIHQTSSINTNNEYKTQTYLYKGSDYKMSYWTMTPSMVYFGRSSLFYVSFDNKAFGSANANISAGLAPVINLTPIYVAQFDGDGSMNNPFRVGF